MDAVTRLGLALASADVQASIAVAIFLAVGITGIGIVIGRRIGVLQDSSAGSDQVATGLSIGLLVCIAIWASIRSGGSSSFLPVAIAFVIAVLAPSRVSWVPDRSSVTRTLRTIWPSLLTLVASIVLLGLTFTMTVAVRADDAGQPVDFLDAAYYAVLGQHLADRGIEDAFSTAGIPLVGLPVQSWYHWGEIWLASIPIAIFDTAPMDARYLIALPLVLAAAAAGTGSLVRRWTRDSGRAPVAFGILACLVLSPIPILAAPYFASYASGLWFGISSYGLAAVAVIRCLDDACDGRAWVHTRAGAVFVAAEAAIILPSHLVVALLSVGGLASALAWAIVTRTDGLVHGRSWRAWMPLAATVGVVVLATALWGVLTGHGVGGVAPSSGVPAFHTTWHAAVISVVAGAGLFWAIPIAMVRYRRSDACVAAASAGAGAVLLAGLVLWGWRYADFNMFHAFFGGLAVIAAPIAAIACWRIWLDLRGLRLRRLRPYIAVFAATQLALGGLFTVAHLYRFGPHDYAPMPASFLDSIRSLPPDARLAYDCVLDEQSVWLPRLMSVTAHTGRAVVPMCFQADLTRTLLGAPMDTAVQHPAFAVAPQRRLFPDRDTVPDAADVLAFMHENGIGHVIADPTRPNHLVPSAELLMSAGGYQLYRVP